MQCPDARDANLRQSELGRMVKEYGLANLAVSKLAGTLAFMRSENATSMLDSSFKSTLESFGDVGEPGPTHLDGHGQYWNLSNPDQYWVVHGKEPLEHNPPSSRLLSASLASAFRGLARESHSSFSISWWAKSDKPTGFTDWVFMDLDAESPRLVVRACGNEAPHPPPLPLIVDPQLLMPAITLCAGGSNSRAGCGWLHSGRMDGDLQRRAVVHIH